MLLFAVIEPGLRIHGASHLWFSPGGGGNGTSAGSPTNFSTAAVTSLLTNTGETEFIIHFLSSSTNYVVTPAITIPSRSDLASLVISLVGEGARPENVRLVNGVEPNDESCPNPDYVIALNSQLPAPGSGQAPMIAVNLEIARGGNADPGGWDFDTGYVGGGWFEDLSDPLYLWGTGYLPGYAPMVTGVSDGGLAAVFPGYKVVGTETKALTTSGTNWTYLSIPSSGWLTNKSRALCISPDGYYVGGYATRTQSSPAVNEQQPVFWNDGEFGALFSGTGLNSSKGGEALAVNGSGQFVGYRTLQAGTNAWYISRAFRSRTDGAEVADGDMLIPPAQDPAVAAELVPSSALTINESIVNASGTAAGWATFDPTEQPARLPVIWWRRSNGGSEVTNAAWVPITQAEGRVNAITADQELFGQVSETGGSNAKAWRWINGWTYGHGFEDKFFVHSYSTNWVLEEIVDASSDRLLIGNGKKAGSPRAFLLVPQPVIVAE